MKGTNTAQKTSSGDYSLTEKVVKTVFLVLGYIMIGLFMEITGPTQKDLIIKSNSNYELVSRAISGRSVGDFIGAIFGGFLVDKLEQYCDLMIALSLDLAAISTIIAPYCRDISLLWFSFVFSGISEAIINIAGQKLLLNIWKERAAGPLHLLHFGFGMGAFIVPQIANPFLAIFETKTTISTNSTLSVEFSTTTPTFEKYKKESRIETAYLIIGIVVASVSLIFYSYQFCCRLNLPVRNVKDKTEKKTIVKKVVKVVDPGTCTGGDRMFGVQVFILLFFYFFNAVGGERIYGKFIRSYSIDKHQFSVDDGSLLNTEFWISFTFGRFVGLFTGRFIPIRILIVLEVVGALSTTIFLEIFARDSAQALWILTAFVGFFVAPQYPSGIGWGDFHVEFTGFAITFVIMGASIGGMAYQWVIGYLYEYHGHDMLMHMMLGNAIIMVVLVAIMTIMGRKHGGRFDAKINQEKNVEVDLSLASVKETKVTETSSKTNDEETGQVNKGFDI